MGSNPIGLVFLKEKGPEMLVHREKAMLRDSKKAATYNPRRGLGRHQRLHTLTLDF